PVFFFVLSFIDPRPPSLLHSFPTRRSSDLRCIEPSRIRPVPIRRKNGVLGRVVPERVEERVGHVRLKAECFGAIHHFEELHHSTDRKSTRLNSSHEWISYAVFCLKKKTPVR